MDERPADNKTPAPHGSPTPAPVDKQQHSKQQQQHTQQQPSPKMQSAPPLPSAHQQQQQQHHQHHQHQHPQYYGAPNGQQLPSPDYRGSPPGAPSMSLPSIQHFEGANMQSQPQYLPASHMNGAPPMMHAPPYNPNMVQYQPQPMPPTMPSNAPNGHNGMMRYPIPPQAPMDVRQMSGGRHKKEIKRRTKSGCLTCRKRRIKVRVSSPIGVLLAKSFKQRQWARVVVASRLQASTLNVKREACATTRVSNTYTNQMHHFLVRRRSSRMSQLPKVKTHMYGLRSCLQD